jgi:hypothetical protein
MLYKLAKGSEGDATLRAHLPSPLLLLLRLRLLRLLPGRQALRNNQQAAAGT